MLQLTSAVVDTIVEERSGIQFVSVILDGKTNAEIAYYLTAQQGRCQVGDHVLVNTTAVDLGLGTGGYHIIVTRLDENEKVDMHPTRWGHIMKMRYTPLQLAVDAIEEQNSPFHHLFTEENGHLKGTIVLIGELHAYLPVVALVLKKLNPDLRLVYVMPDSASLPIAISQHVNHLREMEILSSCITVGHAWGGEIEAVNLYTGLLAARHVAKADVILCMFGPGVVGTGTTFGFSGAELADVIHAVSALGGIPVVIPRISFSDQRKNHFGISHHTRTLLQRLVFRQVFVPLPVFGDWRDQVIQVQATECRRTIQHGILSSSVPPITELAKLQKKYPIPITTMGRDIYQDSSPFQTGYIAAKTARKLHAILENNRQEIISASSTGQDVLATLARLWDARTNDEV
ncbi:DUF3866 family protein [Brevibacillus sp. SYSU BS000544]|uniref:DUF3866 family protein n=1 Tax=Brevibacillus sp. SYSU BS000544 TaxID=3416443 RepID=UPI003CE52E05